MKTFKRLLLAFFIIFNAVPSFSQSVSSENSQDTMRAFEATPEYENLKLVGKCSVVIKTYDRNPELSESTLSSFHEDFVISLEKLTQYSIQNSEDQMAGAAILSKFMMDALTAGTPYTFGDAYDCFRNMQPIILDYEDMQKIRRISNLENLLITTTETLSNEIEKERQLSTESQQQVGLLKHQIEPLRQQIESLRQQIELNLSAEFWISKLQTLNRAFEIFSQEFTKQSTKPSFSIILKVETIEQAEIIATFSVPITIAVEASNIQLSTIIEFYLLDGGEVLLLPSVSEGTDIDSESSSVTFFHNIIPILNDSRGVMGIIAPRNDNPQDSSTILESVLSSLALSGHAYVGSTADELNSISLIADAVGVPYASIVKQINVDDGTIRFIRDLDKTVLQMSAAESTIVFADATPDTLFAIKFWIESQKANSVEFTPVSTIILENRSN